MIRNKFEIHMVFNIDIFFKDVAEIYTEVSLKNIMLMKRDITNSLSILNFDNIEKYIYPFFTQIPIDFNYIKKLQIVKMYMLKKEEIFNKNNQNSEINFLQSLFYNKKYTDYMVLLDIIKNIESDVDYINDYIRHIYNIFENDIINFYRNEKKKINRKQKIKRLLK